MLVISTRTWFKPKSTVSKLAIVYDGGMAFSVGGWLRVPTNPTPAPLDFGFVCEDLDRGLSATLTGAENAKLKVKRETCIPATEGAADYDVSRPVSTRYGKPMIRLLGVPAFRGLLCHPGNDALDTEGCQIPGLHVSPDFDSVLDSKIAWEWLDARVAECLARKERVRWRILRDAKAWAAFRGLAGQ